MGLALSFAVFFIIWWVVLFAVLPWGVRSHEEHGSVEPGTVESAPVAPRLAAKFIATTVIAALIFAGFFITVTYQLISLESLSFIPNFR